MNEFKRMGGFFESGSNRKYLLRALMMIPEENLCEMQFEQSFRGVD